jgi:hypothetical protein
MENKYILKEEFEKLKDKCDQIIELHNNLVTLLSSCNLKAPINFETYYYDDNNYDDELLYDEDDKMSTGKESGTLEF